MTTIRVPKRPCSRLCPPVQSELVRRELDGEIPTRAEERSVTSPQGAPFGRLVDPRGTTPHCRATTMKLTVAVVLAVALLGASAAIPVKKLAAALVGLASTAAGTPMTSDCLEQCLASPGCQAFAKQGHSCRLSDYCAAPDLTCIVGQTGATSNCIDACMSTSGCRSFREFSTGMGHSCVLLSNCKDAVADATNCIIGTAGATVDCESSCKSQPACNAYQVKTTGMSHACIFLSSCLYAQQNGATCV